MYLDLLNSNTRCLVVGPLMFVSVEGLFGISVLCERDSDQTLRQMQNRLARF